VFQLLAEEVVTSIDAFLRCHRMVAEMAHEVPVTSVAFSMCAMFVVTASEDGKLKMWRASSTSQGQVGSLIFEVAAHNAPITKCMFVCNEPCIITASTDSTCKVWNFDGKLQASLIAHCKSVRSIDCNAQKEIVSGSLDLTAKIWSWKRGKPLLRVSFSIPLLVDSCIFSPNGKMILTTHKWNEGAYLFNGNGQKLGHVHLECMANPVWTNINEFTVATQNRILTVNVEISSMIGQLGICQFGNTRGKVG
jgi:WD40 repeat protein